MFIIIQKLQIDRTDPLSFESGWNLIKVVSTKIPLALLYWEVERKINFQKVSRKIQKVSRKIQNDVFFILSKDRG